MTPSTKISRIETFLAPPRRLFVRVETDEGVVGWGEPVVEGRAEPVRAAVPLLADCAPLFAEEPVLPEHAPRPPPSRRRVHRSPRIG